MLNKNKVLEYKAKQEALDIKKYAQNYKCSLEDAFADCISDEPCTEEYAEAIAKELGLSLDSFELVFQTSEEVNAYFNELYNN